MRAAVYLLHFDRPFGHARHYTGMTTRLLSLRLAEHGTKKGAKLLALARAAGVTWQLSRVWQYSTVSLARRKECNLKGRGAARGCPQCRQAYAR